MTAMKSERKPTLARRDFLRTLGIGAGAAAAGSGPLAPDAHADSETKDERLKSRYKETEEVKTFYRVNRYPS
jgi:hypothetical protein